MDGVRIRRSVAQYNALKLSLDGADLEHYTEVKGAFVERVLARAG